MEVSCRNCGKSHTVQDNSVLNKKVFFMCSGCGHKVTVDGRRSFNEPNAPRPGARGFADILGGFRRGFIPFNIAIGSLYFLLLILAGALFARIGIRHAQFFMENMKLSIILGVLVAAGVFYTFCLLNYFISRIIIFRRNNAARKIDFKIVSYDFFDDALSLFIFFLGFVTLSALIFGLIKITGVAAAILAPLLLPVLAVLIFLTITFVILFNFIIAAIAADSHFPAESFRVIIRFIFMEFFNLPIYSFLINLIISSFYTIIAAIAGTAVFIAGAGSLALIPGEAKTSLLSFFSAAASRFLGGSPAGDVPAYAVIGGSLTIIIFLIILSLFLSSLVNITQALHTEAVLIMKANPSRSVHRLVALGFIVALAVSGFILHGFIASQVTRILSLFPFI
jgi:hypothetical protein